MSQPEAVDAETIVSAEWPLFVSVQNRGGRAACQQDEATFRIMRLSQLSAWTPALRRSYWDDLQQAVCAGRNLLSEKYAHMMARTHPREYAALCDALPPRDAERDRLIDGICAAHVAWQEELAARYPRLTGRGRPIRRAADRPDATSFETYLWGELQTYSLQTVRLYAEYTARLQREEQNLCELVLRNMAARYGYASPDAAERALGTR